MTRFRFSLVALMAAVFLVAVGFAALRGASELWTSATFTGTIIVLLVSVAATALPLLHGSSKEAMNWMIRFRFSMGGLLAVVVFTAVGLAAVQYPSEFWFLTVMAFTTAVLGLATFRCLAGRGRTRAFYAGMALFGLGYGGAVWASGVYDKTLPTTLALDYLSRVHPKLVLHHRTHPAFLNLSGVPLDRSPYKAFMCIAHSLFALFFALLAVSCFGERSGRVKGDGEP